MRLTYRVEYTRDDGTLSLVNGTPVHMTWHDATSPDEAATMVERSYAGFKDIHITSVVRIRQFTDEHWNR